MILAALWYYGSIAWARVQGFAIHGRWLKKQRPSTQFCRKWCHSPINQSLQLCMVRCFHQFELQTVLIPVLRIRFASTFAYVTGSQVQGLLHRPQVPCHTHLNPISSCFHLGNGKSAVGTYNGKNPVLSLSTVYLVCWVLFKKFCISWWCSEVKGGIFGKQLLVL